ncbi:MAG: hypothetical protein IJT77_04460 [Clostridia bacterium]|nr:hypothetical protein [Clostridia bacterium]
MPFINSKVSVPVSRASRDEIKSRLGRDIAALGKTENWLMVGFEDNYDLYFAGNQASAAAFVSVALYGQASPEACDRMTERICAIYNEVLGIPKDRIYVTYQFVENWGWNGQNF